MPSSQRVVVVGAGINGLIAAHYLRRAGCAVTMLERTERVGGACVSEVATVSGRSQRYALGASVLGLMPDFIFRETGLADRLETFVPNHAKRVYFPDPKASAWIHRDPAQLERELRGKWGERGDVEGFRHDEARVVGFLQEGYRRAEAPTLESARAELGDVLVRLWISGSASDLLTHYFTADRTRVYMAMTITPRDLQQLFLFPGGNIDHTMLVGGQTFFERQFSADPAKDFYQFGRWPTLAYCGAGAYPCGSIAGTPGYMCARQLIRHLPDRGRLNLLQ